MGDWDWVYYINYNDYTSILSNNYLIDNITNYNILASIPYKKELLSNTYLIENITNYNILTSIPFKASNILYSDINYNLTELDFINIIMNVLIIVQKIQ